MRKNKWCVNKRRCQIIPAFRCHDFIVEKLRLHGKKKEKKNESSKFA